MERQGLKLEKKRFNHACTDEFRGRREEEIPKDTKYKINRGVFAELRKYHILTNKTFEPFNLLTFCQSINHKSINHQIDFISRLTPDINHPTVIKQ
jgi:hypothetical protein